MIILILALIIVVNLIIQSTIFPFFPIMGYVANINLVTIIVVAFLRGKYYGGFFALATGLIQDILFGNVLGVNALIYFLIGYYIGSVNENLNTENPVIPMAFSAIGTIVQNGLYFVLMYFLGSNIELGLALKNIFSWEILYNTILAFFLFRLYARIFVVPSLRFGNR